MTKERNIRKRMTSWNVIVVFVAFLSSVAFVKENHSIFFATTLLSSVIAITGEGIAELLEKLLEENKGIE